MASKQAPTKKQIAARRALSESPDRRPGFSNAIALLPEGDEALMAHAAWRLEQYSDARQCGDAEVTEAAELFYWAAVWKLNGGAIFGCKSPGGGLQRLQEHLAAKPGVQPSWGQLGSWLLEVRGMRMLVRNGCSSLGGGHGVEFKAIDADAPFLNVYGLLNVRLWPDEYPGLDFARAVRAKVEDLLATDHPPVVIADEYRSIRDLPEWLTPALDSVTRNGQQALPLSGRTPAESPALVDVVPKVPKSNAERQRDFRKRQKEEREQAKAEGRRTLVLDDVDLGRIWLALDTHLAFNKLLDWDIEGHLETAGRLFAHQPSVWLDQLGTSEGVVNQQKQREKDAKRGWDAYKEERKSNNKLHAQLNELHAENLRLKRALDEIGAELGGAAPVSVSCDRRGVDQWCNNHDVKIVQLRSYSPGVRNEFAGDVVRMCAECRRSNNGAFKIIKPGASS